MIKMGDVTREQKLYVTRSVSVILLQQARLIVSGPELAESDLMAREDFTMKDGGEKDV